MKNLAVITLGCKVNQYESEAVASFFAKNGYTIVENIDIADVCIINTCSVTNISDRKSRQMIRRCVKAAKNPLVAVTGCYSQAKPDEARNIEGVSVVTGTNNKEELFNLIEQALSDDKKSCEIDENFDGKGFNFEPISGFSHKTRAIIKIQDGCDSFCSYCIIPLVRGRLRSRNPADIISEVENLVKDGSFREIVLAGIHVCKYGVDLEDMSLTKLLISLESIEKLDRIRLSSVEPSAFTDEFFEFYKSSKKLCPHFHISLQSGSDKIIKKMNRSYSGSDFLKIVEKLRLLKPNTTITTDIIVGFPGETEEDFNQTVSLVKKAEFLKTHVFKYSKRSGTKAADMPDQISSAVSDKRSRELIAVSEKITRNVINSFIGNVFSVLLEESEGDYIRGFSENYIPVLVDKNEAKPGDVARVKLTGEVDGEAFGEVKEKLSTVVC